MSEKRYEPAMFHQNIVGITGHMTDERIRYTMWRPMLQFMQFRDDQNTPQSTIFMTHDVNVNGVVVPNSHYYRQAEVLIGNHFEQELPSDIEQASKLASFLIASSQRIDSNGHAFDEQKQYAPNYLQASVIDLSYQNRQTSGGQVEIVPLLSEVQINNVAA